MRRFGRVDSQLGSQLGSRRRFSLEPRLGSEPDASPPDTTKLQWSGLEPRLAPRSVTLLDVSLRSERTVCDALALSALGQDGESLWMKEPRDEPAEESQLRGESCCDPAGDGRRRSAPRDRACIVALTAIAVSDSIANTLSFSRR